MVHDAHHSQEPLAKPILALKGNLEDQPGSWLSGLEGLATAYDLRMAAGTGAPSALPHLGPAPPNALTLEWVSRSVPEPTTGRGHRICVMEWEFSTWPAAWFVPLLADADDVWVRTERQRTTLIHEGFPAGRLAVMPAGYDATVIRPEGPIARVDQRRCLLYVGPLATNACLDRLLPAFVQACGQSNETVLVVAELPGAPEALRQPFLRFIAEHGSRQGRPLLHHLVLPKDPAQRAAYVRGADVVLACDRNPTHPWLAIEALACGVPVVALTGSPAADLLPEGSGWLVPSQLTALPVRRLDAVPTLGYPLTCEPDPTALSRLLQQVAAGQGLSGDFRQRASRAAVPLQWTTRMPAVLARLAEVQARPLAIAQTR